MLIKFHISREKQRKNIAVKSQKDTHETVIATKVFDGFENNIFISL